MVYTAGGQAILDMTLPPMSEGKAPEKEKPVDVTIRYDTGVSELEATELKQMTGYYVEPADLKDLDTVKAQIQALPLGTPVMIDVKSIHGAFYYSSAVSDTRSSQVDVAKMDELLAWLRQQDLYTIAKFPALRDYTYGLNHVPDGVHHSSGGYLYQDDSGCYWLHPASQGTLSYLTQIIIELRNLGFDEVVLEDFCFPQNTDKIKVDGDRKEFLTNAAAELLKACETSRFALSFVKTEDFTPPRGPQPSVYHRQGCGRSFPGGPEQRRGRPGHQSGVPHRTPRYPLQCVQRYAPPVRRPLKNAKCKGQNAK